MNRGERRAHWLARHRTGMRGTRAASQGPVTARRAPGSALHENVPQAPARSVRLHIDELVLHGFPAGSRYSIGDATQQELTRLLTERGVPPRMARSGETVRIDAGSFQVAQGASPNLIGALVATAVYGGPKR